MNKITAVIIEDEIPAARRLNNTLNELRPEWQITVLPGSVKKSVEWFAENPHPDLVFLDIQLTDGISFTFIEQAQKVLSFSPLRMMNMPFGHLQSTVSIIYLSRLITSDWKKQL